MEIFFGEFGKEFVTWMSCCFVDCERSQLFGHIASQSLPDRIIRTFPTPSAFSPTAGRRTPRSCDQVPAGKQNMRRRSAVVVSAGRVRRVLALDRRGWISRPLGRSLLGFFPHRSYSRRYLQSLSFTKKNRSSNEHGCALFTQPCRIISNQQGRNEPTTVRQFSYPWCSISLVGSRDDGVFARHPSPEGQATVIDGSRYTS